MRSVELDDDLLDQALRNTGASSDREAVESALRQQNYLARQAQAGRELFGGFEWIGDLEESRLGHVSE